MNIKGSLRSLNIRIIKTFKKLQKDCGLLNWVLQFIFICNNRISVIDLQCGAKICLGQDFAMLCFLLLSAV